MPITRRIYTTVAVPGEVAFESNILVREMETRPDWQAPAPTAPVFVLRDLWPQINGSAESWPQWARDDYLKEWGNPCGNDSAGGETHLFAVVKGTEEQCGVLHGKTYIAWTDGFVKLGDTGYTGYVGKTADTTHGWVNWFCSNGYYPDQGQRGPWCWCPFGWADVVDGGGLPYNRHVSWFAAWEQMAYAEYLIELGGVPPVLTGEADVEFAKAVALELCTQFVSIRNTDTGVFYDRMPPEEVALRATTIERLLRESYEVQTHGASSAGIAATNRLVGTANRPAVTGNGNT